MPQSPDDARLDDDPDVLGSGVPPGHQADEYGEHDPDGCYQCLLEREPVQSTCRCGNCCRSLIIEVTMEDAEREPRIKELGSPTYSDPRQNGQRELEGYMLNSPANDYACAFLDRQTNLCTIHATRPLLCRLFDCDGDGRQKMIELGIHSQDEE